MSSIRGKAYWRIGEYRYELELDDDACLAVVTKDGKEGKHRLKDKVVIRHVIEELRSGEYELFSTSCSLYDEETHAIPEVENVVHFIPNGELTCYKIDSILSKSFLNSVPEKLKEKPKRYDIWEDETLSADEKFDEWFLEWTLATQRLIRDMNSGVLDAIYDAEIQAVLKRIKKNDINKKRKKRNDTITNLIRGILILYILYILVPKEIKFRTEYSVNRFLDRTCSSYSCSRNDSKSIDDVKRALENNPYFSDEDKALFGNLWKIVEENKEYINLNEIVENISEFNFIRSDVSPDDGSIIADYVPFGVDKNKITIFAPYYDLGVGQKNSVKLHEVGHGLTNYCLFSDTGCVREIISFLIDKMSTLRSSILDELADTVFTNDYCSYLIGDYPTFDNAIGYSFYMPAFYGVCEIVGSEPIREFKFTRDLSVLVEALSSVDGDVKRAYDFFQMFERLENAIETDKKHEIDEVAFLISTELEYYYEARFNRSIYDDVYMCMLLYGSSFESPGVKITLKEFFEQEDVSFRISSLKKYLAHEGRDYSIIEAYGRTYIVNEENRYMNDTQKTQDEKVMTIKPIS